MFTTIISLGLAIAGINNDIQTKSANAISVVSQAAIISVSDNTIDPSSCFDDPGFSKRHLQSKRWDYSPVEGRNLSVVG